MNRKMSAVSNTHTKITAIERVILNKETIDALSNETSGRRSLIARTEGEWLSLRPSRT